MITGLSKTYFLVTILCTFLSMNCVVQPYLDYYDRNANYRIFFDSEKAPMKVLELSLSRRGTHLELIGLLSFIPLQRSGPLRLRFGFEIKEELFNDLMFEAEKVSVWCKDMKLQLHEASELSILPEESYYSIELVFNSGALNDESLLDVFKDSSNLYNPIIKIECGSAIKIAGNPVQIDTIIAYPREPKIVH